jgi:methylmalonyl-CoA/ethylmalonyl-CoA epimerase
MKIKGINHLGIVPKDISLAKIFFGDILNIHQSQEEEVVPDQKVRVHFFDVNESRIELIEPTTPDSPVQKYLNERGSGIQHVAFEVDNIDDWIKFLSEKGVQMIDNVSKKGAHNTKIAFVHPRSTGGVLVELVEEQNI